MEGSYHLLSFKDKESLKYLSMKIGYYDQWEKIRTAVLSCLSGAFWDKMN